MLQYVPRLALLATVQTVQTIIAVHTADYCTAVAKSVRHTQWPVLWTTVNHLKMAFSQVRNLKDTDIPFQFSNRALTKLLSRWPKCNPILFVKLSRAFRWRWNLFLKHWCGIYIRTSSVKMLCTGIPVLSLIWTSGVARCYSVYSRAVGNLTCRIYFSVSVQDQFNPKGCTSFGLPR